MTDKRDLIASIEQVFLRNQYTWTDPNTGEHFTPTPEHLAAALDECRKAVLESLKDADDDQFVQLEVGRLLVTSRDGVLDVYVHHGELSLED